MKTEKSIQFLSNNRKLIAGPCKKQFFLSFYLFYYIHTPVPPLSQANQSDGNRVAREVGFDHHLTTSSPQPVPLIVCTLQHSFITTTNNAESCAHYTISGAVSWHLPARHSSPTPKARGSPPVGSEQCFLGTALFWFVLKNSSAGRGHNGRGARCKKHKIIFSCANANWPVSAQGDIQSPGPVAMPEV